MICARILSGDIEMPFISIYVLIAIGYAFCKLISAGNWKAPLRETYVVFLLFVAVAMLWPLLIFDTKK